MAGRTQRRKKERLRRRQRNPEKPDFSKLIEWIVDEESSEDSSEEEYSQGYWDDVREEEERIAQEREDIDMLARMLEEDSEW